METIPSTNGGSPELSFEQEMRELHDLQKENFEEYEEWRKRLEEVALAIRAKGGAIQEVAGAVKQKALAGATDMHILYVILGGGMQGPYGAGQITALQEMGYVGPHLDIHDTFLGISTGAPTCAFGMAGHKQSLLGTSIYYTFCTTPAFIDYSRLHRVIDVGAIERALREGPLALDVAAVRANPARFFVQAYNKDIATPEFIDAKEEGIDMITAIHASMAIPLAYGEEVFVNETRYTDGTFGDPLPLVRAIERFHPTHILILPNIPFNKLAPENPDVIRGMIAKILPERGWLGDVRRILEERQRLRRVFDEMASFHNVKIGVAWPPDMGLFPTIRDSQKIRVAIKISAKAMFALFGESERELKLYEEEFGDQA